MPTDYYEILGVAPEATLDEIKHAYKRRAKEWHPDRATGSEEKFKTLVQAYKILTDGEARKQYDRKRRNSSPESFINRFSGFKGAAKVAAETARKVMNDFVGENIVETIDEILGRKQEPRDIEISLKITLEELYEGADKRVVFKRNEPCDSCKGRGAKNASDVKVCPSCYGIGHKMSDLTDLFTNHECKKCKGAGRLITKKCSECKGKGECKYSRDFTFPIPKDLNFGESHDRLIVPKEGEYGGNLLINVELKPHKFYEVNWPDLKLELPIEFYQAILGDRVKIDTLAGSRIFKIPPGTGLQSSVILKGCGLRKTENDQTVRGDLEISLYVELPDKITTKQKSLLEEYIKAGKSSKKAKPKKK